MYRSQQSPKALFISGGATGIGKETAKRMLAHGWTVGCYDIVDVEWGDEAAHLPGNLITGHLDVRNWEDWEAALEDFTSHTGGKLHAFFNNAGVIIDGRLHHQDPEKIQWLVDINVVGVTYGAKACHRYLSRTPGAVMVSMSSAAAIVGQPEVSTYSASKFYVSGLTEALALEWAPDHIRVHDLMPLWAKSKISEVDARSINTLGVKLMPDDIAAVAEKVFLTKNPYLRKRMHHNVSNTDRVLKVLSDFSPDIVRRYVSKAIVG